MGAGGWGLGWRLRSESRRPWRGRAWEPCPHHPEQLPAAASLTLCPATGFRDTLSGRLGPGRRAAPKLLPAPTPTLPSCQRNPEEPTPCSCHVWAWPVTSRGRRAVPNEATGSCSVYNTEQALSGASPLLSPHFLPIPSSLGPPGWGRDCAGYTARVVGD